MGEIIGAGRPSGVNGVNEFPSFIDFVAAGEEGRVATHGVK